MPDAHYLSAAIGWLGLDNCREAHLELDRIKPQLQTHPDALKVRGEVYAKESNWEKVAAIMQVLRAADPKDEQHWISLAYATRRQPGGGLERAREILIDAQKRFPNEPLIAYNLACYDCQLGDVESARAWLEKAISAGNATAVKFLALADQDLKPLWPELKVRFS